MGRTPRTEPPGAGPVRAHGRGVRLVLAALLAVAWLAVLPGGAGAQQHTVLVTEVEGTITPVIADHLRDGVARAEEEGHAALVVEMDTPGGLDASMREIIQEFLEARVPVVVHVTPSGARAASAGALITFSSHVAAMAPGTTIGAATPVDMDRDEVSEKVLNDAAAYAASVAEQRDRNAEFARQTVVDGRAVTAPEAVELGAVDLLARDRAALLEAVDGREVTLGDGATVTLETADAGVVEYDMGFFRGVLQILADPNLSFLFLSLGALAVIYELASPGMGVGGTLGAILLILGFFSLSVLPVNVAGLALLLLAGVLFVGELFTPGVGVFATGGSIALLAGGLFLFEGTLEVSPGVLIPTTIVIGLGVVLAGRLAWRARRSRPVSGAEAAVGRELTVTEAGEDGGRGLLDGTSWQLRSDRGVRLREGRRVRVTAVEGVTLVVEPVEPVEPDQPEQPDQPGEPDDPDETDERQGPQEPREGRETREGREPDRPGGAAGFRKSTDRGEQGRPGRDRPPWRGGDR